MLNGSGCVRRVAGVVLRVPEQQRDAPETCQPDQRVDDPGEDGGLPTEQERDGVKAEQPQFSAPTITRISAILSTIILYLLCDK